MNAAVFYVLLSRLQMTLCLWGLSYEYTTSAEESPALVIKDQGTLSRVQVNSHNPILILVVVIILFSSVYSSASYISVFHLQAKELFELLTFFTLIDFADKTNKLYVGAGYSLQKTFAGYAYVVAFTP